MPCPLKFLFLVYPFKNSPDIRQDNFHYAGNAGNLAGLEVQPGESGVVYAHARAAALWTKGAALAIL